MGPLTYGRKSTSPQSQIPDAIKSDQVNLEENTVRTTEKADAGVTKCPHVLTRTR